MKPTVFSDSNSHLSKVQKFRIKRRSTPMILYLIRLGNGIIAIDSQSLYSSLFPVPGLKNSSFQLGRGLVIIVNIVIIYNMNHTIQMYQK